MKCKGSCVYKNKYHFKQMKRSFDYYPNQIVTD